MEKYILPERNVIYSDKAEIDTTLTVTLDEYCPNVVRILRCDVFPALMEKTLSENGVEYSGKNVFRLIYVSDYNDSIRSVNFEEDFSGIMRTGSDLHENDDAKVSISVKPVTSSAKILSARQLELKGRTLVSAEIAETAQREIFGKQAENDENLCVLEETFENCRRIKLSDEKIVFESDVALSQDEKSVGELLYTEIMPYITRTECKEGMLSVWGEMKASFVYSPEDSDEMQQSDNIVCVERKLPFETQIYEDGITENGFAVAEVSPLYVKTGVSYDPYGENRLLSLTADMEVSGSVWECGELCVCTDAFAIENNVCAKFSPVSFERMAGNVCESVHVSEKLHADIRNFASVTECTMSAKLTGTEISDGKMYAVLHFDVSMLGNGENGVPNHLKTGFNTKVPLNSAVYPQGVRADLYTGVTDGGCSIKSGELIAFADVNICGVLTEKNTVNAVSETVPCEKSETDDKGQIIVYYPDENESVWETAKKYSVNPEKLKEQNGIEGDSLSGVRMIVVTR